MTVAARQIPPPGAVVLDHVAFFASRMEDAERALGRLGFTLTPFTPQRNRTGGRVVAAGTGNRLAMLEEGYIEVLSTTGEDTPLARQFRAALARYPGLHVIAFGEADAAAVQARLAAGGLPAQPTVNLERAIPTETGEGLARFSVVRLEPGVMPEGRVQVCCHHSPELVWQDRWLGHANGARALGDVLVAVADVGEAAERFARFTGIATTPGAHATRRLQTARGALTLAGPEALARLLPGAAAPDLPFIAALGVETADMARTTAWLDRAGLPLRRSPSGAVLVPPAEALGATIAFFEAGEAPW